jgi:crotonobetainyl-CoA:carnitine CoA-transferase CaiB-like acyl-CoA transferase
MQGLLDARVVDRTTGIGGAYCTKLLADAGADVVVVEPPQGDPLRAWRTGALFEFLHTSKRSVVGAEGALDGPLVAAADVVVVDDPAAVRPLRDRHPGLVVVSITPYGCDGPWVGRPSTEFTLQAWCGSTGARGFPDEPPLAAGGRVGDWVTGTYAAVATAGALRTSRRTGWGEHVDVAQLDCMAVSMVTYPSVFSSMAGWPEIVGTGRTVEVPSIEPTADGYACFTTNSAQQFHDFLVVIERPDLLDDAELARAPSRFARRDEFLAAVHAYTTAHSTDEVLELAALLRVPAGPVLDGATVPSFEQFTARGVYEPLPSGRAIAPRRPYRIHGVDAPVRRPAPAIGEHTATVDWPPRPAAARPPSGSAPPLPLDGVRVLDCTAWWAGPAAGHALALLGADVVKVESVTRPDLMRYAVARPPDSDRWYEWGPVFHAVNAGKRGITLDLASPDGKELFERLVPTADVVIENMTPRVMEHFGLGWDRLHALNPELLMVRMPAFGLDGPWRERGGFAQTMESVSGMAWLTGRPDGPPVLVRGACDPLAGMHAVFATIVALAGRDAGGGGRLVESVMVEAALNAAAEQVVDHSAGGPLLRRDGNRGPTAAPQGLYRCAGTDRWLALAIEDDEQWAGLVSVLEGPPWAKDPELATADGRRAAHDAIDAELADWSAGLEVDDAVERLLAAGVPAGVVITPRDVVSNPQLRHRGLFELEHHAVCGDHELPTMPFRFASVDRWMARPSPTLGQHTREVLAEAGVTQAELDDLEANGRIGERVVGA